VKVAEVVRVFGPPSHREHIDRATRVQEEYRKEE
jgi:hypothetical protein